MYVDPWGEEIVLIGSDTDRKDLLAEMQKITDYALYIESEEDQYGILIHRVRLGAKRQNTVTDLSAGNALLEGLVEEKHTVSIGYELLGVDDGEGGLTRPINDAAAIDGYGTDAIIGISRDANVPLYVLDESGNVTVDPNTPMHITVAHELIHAYHYMKGIGTSGAIQAHNATGYREEYKKVEEYATVGIPYEYADRTVSAEEIERKYGGITENAIRRGLGLPERIAHAG